jgi:hypothetical protein
MTTGRSPRPAGRDSGTPLTPHVQIAGAALRITGNGDTKQNAGAVLNPPRGHRFGPVQERKYSFLGTGRFVETDITERYGTLNGNFLLHTLFSPLQITA